MKSAEIDTWPYLKRCTFDIICGIVLKIKIPINFLIHLINSFSETAMGTSFNSQLDESSEYIQACHK